VRLLEADIRELAAVASMPTQRCAPKPPRLVHQEKPISRASVRLTSRGERDRRVAGVEGAAEAAVGGALRGHEQMFASSC
jgi:hypothetical protein